MALVVALMSAVYIYAVFTFDAEYVESVRQQSLAQLAQSGLPREQMKVAVNSIEATLKPTTMFITTGLSSFVGNIIVVLVAMCFLKEAKTYNDVMDKL